MHCFQNIIRSTYNTNRTIVSVVKLQMAIFCNIFKFRMYPRNKRQFSDFVKIVEVGPRDGLQNEARIIPTSTKVDFINRLSRTGLKSIEVTSFVSPKWVRQMADNAQVFEGIEKRPSVSYPVLVPNTKGLESAIKVGAKEIAVFASASEAFCQKNVNCSISDSIKNFSTVIKQALEHGIKVRGYISCIAGCPYEGEINPNVVASLASVMLGLGCYEISLGDTIGVGTPRKVRNVLNEIKSVSSTRMDAFAMHCHDTYGQALVNIYEALDFGIRVFDSSVAGLGGCPYAAGASGNVATEDLLYFFHGQGFETGVNFDQIVCIGEYICKELNRTNRSKAGLAMLAKRNIKSYS